MRKHLLITAMLFAAAALNAAEYSFGEALKRVYLMDQGVISAQKSVEQSRAERNAARGLYLPSVGVQGKYTYIDAPLAMDLSIPPMLPTYSLQIQDDRFFKAEAVASLPLYTGGKIRAANLAANAYLDESKARLEGIKNNMLSELSEKYFGAILAYEVSLVREQHMKSALEHAQNSEKMFKVGMIAKVEKMAADLTYTQAKRDYRISLNEAELANNILRNALYETGPIYFTSSLFICDEKDIESLEFFKKTALTQNAALKVYDSKELLANAAIKEKTSAFIPTVYAFGLRELYEDDLTVLDPKYAYGLGLEWSLFEGGQSLNKRKAAKLQKESLLASRKKQEKDINTYLEYYYKSMFNAIYKYKSVQQEIKFSKEFLKARILAFKAGTGTSLEVETARTRLLKSEIESLSASYEFVNSLAAILNISGNINKFEDYKAKAINGRKGYEFKTK